MDSWQSLRLGPTDRRQDDENALVVVWTDWARLREALSRMARASGLATADQDVVLDEVLHRLLQAALEGRCPRFPVAWCRVALRRELAAIRKRPGPEELAIRTESRVDRGPVPGCRDFWEWVGDHEACLSHLCTALEWAALLATRRASTIREAAARCGQTRINYRNLRDRAARKILVAIAENLVPPLFIREGSGIDMK